MFQYGFVVPGNPFDRLGFGGARAAIGALRTRRDVVLQAARDAAAAAAPAGPGRHHPDFGSSHVCGGVLPQGSPAGRGQPWPGGGQEARGQAAAEQPGGGDPPPPAPAADAEAEALLQARRLQSAAASVLGVCGWRWGRQSLFKPPWQSGASGCTAPASPVIVCVCLMSVRAWAGKAIAKARIGRVAQGPAMGARRWGPRRALTMLEGSRHPDPRRHHAEGWHANAVCSAKPAPHTDSRGQPA